MLYRIYYLFILFFLVSGCGFRPLYNQTSHVIWDKIFIAPIEGQFGQSLRNHLLSISQKTDDEKEINYVLKVALETKNFDVGLLTDSSSSNVHKNIKMTYRLIQTDNSQEIYHHTSVYDHNYTILQSAFATRSSDIDITERLLKHIALEIHHHITQILKYKHAKN